MTEVVQFSREDTVVELSPVELKDEPPPPPPFAFWKLKKVMLKTDAK